MAEFGPRADRYIAHLQGTSNRIDAAFTVLKELGLSVPQIPREKYIFVAVACDGRVGRRVSW
jgi:hypothetical protein